MFNKFLSLLILIGMIATSNLSVSAQTQSSESKNSQQSQILLKKEFFNSAERANELLDKDSFANVKKGSITAKAMQDADKTQQKKKFAGLNITTAVIIGAVLVTAIVIIFAIKGGDNDGNGPVQCGGIRAPCP